MKSLPSVSLYIRITDKKGRRRYERIRRRSPQVCGPKDVYCIHFYEKGMQPGLGIVDGDDGGASRAALGEGCFCCRSFCAPEILALA